MRCEFHRDENGTVINIVNNLDMVFLCELNLGEASERQEQLVFN